MKISYHVFSVNRQPHQTEVTLPGGETTQALVDAIEVQLVPLDALQGTVKLVAIGAQATEAEALFVVGETIDVSFNRGGA